VPPDRGPAIVAVDPADADRHFGGIGRRGLGGAKDVSYSGIPKDTNLVNWLRSLDAGDRETLSRFAYENYTHDDVLELVTRDDLRRMNLR